MNGRWNAQVSPVACLAVGFLTGLLGCGGRALKATPGHDASASVSDVIAADMGNGSLDSGGSQTQSDSAVDAGVPDAAAADAAISDLTADAPQVPDAPNSIDAGPRLDACVPITCVNHATCDYGDYCGTIGDGCGGTLDCPTICPRVGSDCQDNICKAYVPCTPRTCTDTTGYQ